MAPSPLMSHQHWQVGMAEHVTRHAAKDEAANGMAGEGTHHQHVSAKLMGRPQQGFAEGLLSRDRQHVQLRRNAVLVEDVRETGRLRGVARSREDVNLFGARCTPQAREHGLDGAAIVPPGNGNPAPERCGLASGGTTSTGRPVSNSAA